MHSAGHFSGTILGFRKVFQYLDFGVVFSGSPVGGRKDESDSHVLERLIYYFRILYYNK